MCVPNIVTISGIGSHLWPLLMEKLPPMASASSLKTTWNPCTCAVDLCITVIISVLQARVERMEDYHKKGDDISKALNESRRKLAEAQKKVQELSASSTDDAKAELSKAQAEEKKQKKEERDIDKKLAEHNREEKKMPWNVDTLSKEGFSKVRQILDLGLASYSYIFTTSPYFNKMTCG